MARIVREGETIVACSDDSELESTAIETSTAKGPMTGPASEAKIDSWLAGLPAPRPSVPIPANEITATESAPRASALGADSGERDHRDGAGDVDDDDREDREQGGPSRCLLRVLGLLVHRDDCVPAPEQEDRQRHRSGDGGEVTGGERIEPIDGHRCRVEGGAAGDLDE